MIFSAVLWLLLSTVDSAASLAMSNGASILTQQAKSASPYVGSAMAVLATLEQAQVLPPEGSREADRVIQSVIQLQSVFAKSTDRSVQEFAHHAITNTPGGNVQMVLERFRSNGWTAEILMALAEADMRASAEERQEMAAGLGQFNLSVDDFRRFMQLVRDGRAALEARGQNFDEVYARHRNAMPGATAREGQ
ncbi:MAG: hypothetical protein HC801_04870 [Nitrospira sp.]|nr:hypothetical protein [Nitrospira sp.]